MMSVYPYRTAKTVRATASALLPPSAASSSGIGLHFMGGLGTGPALAVAITVGIMSGLVAIARVFAPYLAEVIRATSIASIRRAARKGSIEAYSLTRFVM